MTLDVETAINLTSSALMLVLGVAAAVVARDKRRGFALALYAGAFALSTAARGLETMVGGEPFILELSRFVLYPAGGAGAFLFALTLARGEGARARRKVALWVALAWTLATIAFTAATWALAVEMGGWGGTTYAFLLGGGLGASILLAVEFAHAPTQVERTRLALCAAALAIYGGFYALFVSGALSLFLWIAVLYGISVPVAALAWALAARAGPAARNVSLLVTLAGATGLIVALVPAPTAADYGIPGVTRILSVAMLAYAVFKLDLLGAGFAPRTVHRGTLATGALAALFIVAQVAQNFLTAEYGLLMGGIIAGAFLFAASPIQKAIERAGAARSVRLDAREAPETAASAGLGKEEAYRNALRIALRDRVLTDEEEVHLAHLSDELNLTHRRAREIRNEVEREARARVAR